MPLLKTFILTFIAALCLGHAQASTLALFGVKLDSTLELSGTRLLLNGAGTRYKGPFKVYVAGLYLAQKAATSEAVIAQAGRKRLSLTMLRDIDATELGTLLTRGIEDNLGSREMSQLIPGLMRMSHIFSTQRKLRAGDNLLIEWIPGTGCVITVRGQTQGEAFKEPEFFKAMMWIWLGPAPADRQLKAALLDQPLAP
jgi:hypothetical protein